MRRRVFKVLTVLLLFVIAGLLYGLFYIATGIGIPCTFHMITGLSCPGCGITRMCISLMRGDIIDAMRYNVMLFFISPILLYILGSYLFRYVKTGEWFMPRWQTIVTYTMSVLLIVFGFVRNFIGI